VARRLRLLQPDKLLDQLARNFALPEVARKYVGKCRLTPEGLRARLENRAGASKPRVVLTGASSVDAYAVMAREPVQALYCTDVEAVARELGEDLRETDRFANVQFLQTDDATVYFDKRASLVASPIQVYLELVAGEKRERETAEQVRRAILEPLARALREGE
jgi:hypothetical protein